MMPYALGCSTFPTRSPAVVWYNMCYVANRLLLSHTCDRFCVLLACCWLLLAVSGSLCHIYAQKLVVHIYIGIYVLCLCTQQLRSDAVCVLCCTYHRVEMFSRLRAYIQKLHRIHVNEPKRERENSIIKK